jgi:hypothetical protein
MKSLFLWLAVLSFTSLAQGQTQPVWKFAVSGDSRNCGDVVMPAIAIGAAQNAAEFYWHLGDFRAIYQFDEDIVGVPPKPMYIDDYLDGAWPDFIKRQLTPFKQPIYLVIGNHEVIPPKTREGYLIQFADWLGQDDIRAQRLKDDPTDHSLHTYYHWIEHGVDFISMDNSDPLQFDKNQVAWLKKILTGDTASSEVKSIVVGMHEALPGSVAHVHSMGDFPQENKSGREVYAALWEAHRSSAKPIYVLASHSHFYMDNIFDTPDWSGKVLPGWIVGTAGAVRYKLPDERKDENHAQTNVYGYMIGTVTGNGSISFEFKKLELSDLKQANTNDLGAVIDWCFANNHL